MCVNRRRTSTLLALAIVVVGAAASGGSAAKTTFRLGAAPTLTSTYSAPKSTSGALAQTDPSLLRSDRLETGQRDDQVRPRRDRVVCGRGRGLRRDEPVGHRQAPRPERRRRLGLRPSPRSGHRPDQRGDRQGGARMHRSARPIRRPTAASRHRCRQTRSRRCSACRVSQPCRRTRFEQPLDDNTAFIGATAVWPQLGGSAQGRVARDRRRPRHRRLAREPDALTRRSRARAGGRPLAVRLRRRQRRRPPRPGLPLQQQADRRLQLHADLHGRERLRRPGVLQRHDGYLLGARPGGPRDAHDDDGRRRLRQLGRRSTASTAARCAGSRRART